MKLSLSCCIFASSLLMLTSGLRPSQDCEFMLTTFLKQTQTCQKKVETLKSALNIQAKSNLRSVSTGTQQSLSRTSFTAIQENLLETIRGVHYNREIQTSSRRRKTNCPNVTTVQGTLSIPGIQSVTIAGEKLQNETYGDLINMCHECYYDVKLNPIYIPDIIRVVVCNSPLCIKETAKCVEKKLLTKIIKMNLDGTVGDLHGIFVTKGCCCERRRRFGWLN